jgi:hypothetical protein
LPEHDHIDPKVIEAACSAYGEVPLARVQSTEKLHRLRLEAAIRAADRERGLRVEKGYKDGLSTKRKKRLVELLYEEGDVLLYTPTERHCREGMAFVSDRGIIDTYWRSTGDGESHILTADELATAKVLFNIRDFDVLDRYSAASRETWLAYHPADRQRITSQHGLQEELFVRCGAQPHLATQIENARERVNAAEQAVEQAEGFLRRKRGVLAGLEAGVRVDA